MSLPAEIGTDRFRLPVITPAEAAGMLAGHREPNWHPDYPRTDDLDAASMVPKDDTLEVGWGPRHVVRRFDDLVIGGIGFYGPPTPADDGIEETEVGYGLVEYARGHGVASEALAAMVAAADALGVRVRASVAPDNAASLKVLARCGFTLLRGANEDGDLVMARPVPAALPD